jgi:hypothetical protein
LFSENEFGSFFEEKSFLLSKIDFLRLISFFVKKDKYANGPLTPAVLGIHASRNYFI